MYTAVLRAAMEVAASMLLATLLVTVLGPLMPLIIGPLPSDNVLVQTLNQVEPTFPLIVLVGAVMALVARGIVESRLPGV